MPLPSDPTGPERPPERASWFALVRQLMPVVVPLLLFVQIVAWGIAPALEQQALLQERAEEVQSQYRTSKLRHEKALREKEFLSDPVGQERLRRRLEQEQEQGVRTAQETLRELAASSRPREVSLGSTPSSTPAKKAR